MDVQYEDTKLHDDGILDGFIGYKEWFHYEGTFFVDGIPLTFVIGFPRSCGGAGVIGWISYKSPQSGKTQFSLDENPPDEDNEGFFKLETRANIRPKPSEALYIITYPRTKKDSPDNGDSYPKNDKNSDPDVYEGTVTGQWPNKKENGNPCYTITVKTPDLRLTITMDYNPHSVIAQEPCCHLVGGWFHTGKVNASITGKIEGNPIDAHTQMAWYERNWSKLPVFWPSQWLWFMAHLDNGSVFDSLEISTMGVRVPYFNECWLYLDETLYEFPHYWVHFPETVEEAIREKDYSRIVKEKKECITCGGRNEENSFLLQAAIVDFRQYTVQKIYASINWTNFILEITGKAIINGDTILLNGRGVAERTPMCYWWL